GVGAVYARTHLRHLVSISPLREGIERDLGRGTRLQFRDLALGYVCFHLQGGEIGQGGDAAAPTRTCAEGAEDDLADVGELLRDAPVERCAHVAVLQVHPGDLDACPRGRGLAAPRAERRL